MSVPVAAPTGNRICRDAIDLVGHTPMVFLNKVTDDPNIRVAVKLEYMNPGCSVKDRSGTFMLDEAERRGLITRGKTVLIEVTSGNMGIGLAWAAAVRGYRLVLVMPSSYSLERRAVIRAFGAELMLVDPAVGVEGMLERVALLNRQIPNSYALNQFSNDANPLAHYRTTGPEIWDQTNGQVDIICFGVGTGGTMSGAGRFLKEKNPNVEVFAVEPFESSVISGEPAGNHTIFGIGAGVIPPNCQPIYDGAVRVKSEDAYVMAKRLAKEEGLLAGVSGGANVSAAIQLAKKPENRGKLVVTCLPDFGERYLSSILYKEIKQECELMADTTLEENLAQLSKTWGIEL